MAKLVLYDDYFVNETRDLDLNEISWIKNLNNPWLKRSKKILYYLPASQNNINALKVFGLYTFFLNWIIVEQQRSPQFNSEIHICFNIIRTYWILKHKMPLWSSSPDFNSNYFFSQSVFCSVYNCTFAVIPLNVSTLLPLTWNWVC